ncbi:MAG: hypothetical protein ACYCXF_08400 [Thermoleophilia bacterium]
MSKLALTGLVALVILLVGAGAVFAQSNPMGYGNGTRGTMMNSGAYTGTQTTPGSGNYGYGMMYGTNGAGIGAMGNVDWNAMHDAMNSGNWDAMVNICRDAINNGGQGATNTPATPQTSAPTRGTGSTTGTSSATGTTSQARTMMGSRF